MNAAKATWRGKKGAAGADSLVSVTWSPLASNGEVEGPDDHVGQATRARHISPRPRRQTTHASRTLQRLLGSNHDSLSVFDYVGLRKYPYPLFSLGWF
jgi:hypothetical protein